jgi:hypothetical protein
VLLARGAVEFAEPVVDPLSEDEVEVDSDVVGLLLFSGRVGNGGVYPKTGTMRSRFRERARVIPIVC